VNSDRVNADAALQDRVQGVLLGLAAGDRNGGPVRMALRLAESLLARRDLDTDDLLSRYLGWWREDGIDSGPTTARVLERIDQGVPPAQAVEQVHTESGGLTAGCNPAHRSPPLAMAGFLPDGALPALAVREAALTHAHPLAGDVAAAVVALCRALLRGAGWEETLTLAAAGRGAEASAALAGGRLGPGGRGGYAPETLQSAVFFVGGADNFGEALGRSLDFAGPANYCPVLVGAIAGARWGAGAIAPSWLRHPRLVAIEEEVVATAASLAGTWGPATSSDS
jgi:ADP-ribosylglycohydrolase